MKPGNKNSYNSLKSIDINNRKYKYYSLSEAEKNGLDGISKLPKSLKVLLENLLRYEDDLSVTKSQIEAIKEWLKTKKSLTEIAYRPARVLLQDYTGIPAVADLAAMREAVKEKNKDPNTINPLSAVDLVIDHSVQVDKSANKDSFEKNVDIEFKRNGERYSFLKWGQQAFNNFRIVPPGTGICHQVNLEYLSKVVWSEKFQNEDYLFPDTLVGTDSHTTMVNGLSVLGWGVGGIEAEAGMLGQPISMLIPEVIGFEVKNKMPEGTTATDLVLTVVKMLRDKGVVGKFVEFYGEGLKNLTLADRATIANMAPEYGATCGFFPIDNETLKYLRQGGRIGKVEGTIGDFLSVKPVILVNDEGVYVTKSKGVGIKRTLMSMRKELKNKFNDDLIDVTIHYGNNIEKAENLKLKIEQSFNTKNVEMVQLTPVLGIHTGPEMFAIIAKRA